MLSVLKYGGTSVSTTEKIDQIAKYLKTRIDKGEKLIVVLSAMGKETDYLIDMAQQLSVKPEGREFDQLLSLGEIKSVSLLALSLLNIGVKAKSLVGEKTGILTYGEFQNSKIKEIDIEYLSNQLCLYDILVIAGFQGVNNENEITTLGRGGSDTTAVALASVLGVDCEIYTDVDGIYQIDPRISELSKKLDYIAYDEMCELSSLGATVMHNRSIRLASRFNTNVTVNASLNLDGGTKISNKNFLEENTITGIGVEKNVTHFSVEYNNSKYAKERIFTALSDNRVNFDMLSFSVLGSKDDVAFVNFAINETPEKVDNLVTQIKKVTDINAVQINQYTKISLVGTGLREGGDIITRIVKSLSEIDKELYHLTLSDISLSFLVDSEDITDIVDRLMYYVS